MLEMSLKEKVEMIMMKRRDTGAGGAFGHGKEAGASYACLRTKVSN